MSEENIKIASLEIENAKRIKAVKIEPSKNGLTVIGGKNAQGKTSVLDCICWALKGKKYMPSEPHREGSVTDPYLKIRLNNGLVVERKGKNSDLKVIDPQGNKGSQGLLDSFIEELALNLPKFMESSSKEKANTLLQIIGVGDQLALLEKEEKETYNNRRSIGQIADQKDKFAKEMPFYPDAPKIPVSAGDLIREQQDILATNGENARKRQRVSEYERQKAYQMSEVEQLQRQLDAKKAELAETENNLTIAKMDALDLLDQSTETLEQSIRDIDEINAKVRANMDKEKAEEDARELCDQYNALTKKIDEVRKKKMDLLNGANMPLDGLSVEEGELTFNGYKWDNMSGAEQLRVATAIVQKLNPKCGFVLLDKLEQMDTDTLNEFGFWLESQGLQAIATRVSTGDECSIIIEDGYVKDASSIISDEKPKPKWKAGEF